jgi:hypothetical protein
MMTKKRISDLTKAQNAFYEGDVTTAVDILEKMWEELPFDYEVFRLLNECYMAQEEWDASEQLIMAFSETPSGAVVKNDALLMLYLAQRDAPNALLAAEAIILENPEYGDFLTSLGYNFKNAGFEPEFLNMLDTLRIDGFDNNLALANYFGNVIYDYATAIEFVNESLKNDPDNQLFLSYKQQYEENLVRKKILEAQKKISGEADGDGIAEYREILAIRPDSLTAQEYYLSALACRYFPPFYWYFYRNNIVGTSPYSFRVIIYLIFFIACTLYYNGAKPSDSPDQLHSVIWLFSLLVVPRYTLFPALVQLLAFKHLPGYHLLKKPYDFIKGSIILAAWIGLLCTAADPDAKGFQYFIAGSFMTYVFLLDYADQLTDAFHQKMLRMYTLIGCTIAGLSLAKVIPDAFLFFVFAGWLPPVLLGSGLEYYQKLQKERLAENKEDMTEDAVNRRHSRKAHLLALLTAIGMFVLFVIANQNIAASSEWLFYFSFATMLLAITVFSFTQDDQFGRAWRNKPTFRWVFVALSTGMVSGIMLTQPYGDTPIREDWRWIPGVLLFLGCWAGLFLLYYRHARKDQG